MIARRELRIDLTFSFQSLFKKLQYIMKKCMFKPNSITPIPPYQTLTTET